MPVPSFPAGSRIRRRAGGVDLDREPARESVGYEPTAAHMNEVGRELQMARVDARVATAVVDRAVGVPHFEHLGPLRVDERA